MILFRALPLPFRFAFGVGSLAFELEQARGRRRRERRRASACGGAPEDALARVGDGLPRGGRVAAKERDEVGNVGG